MFGFGAFRIASSIRRPRVFAPFFFRILTLSPTMSNSTSVRGKRPSF
jgi:hypothetical protein